MQTTTSALEEEAKKFELVINVAKTKVMTVGNWKLTGKIKIGSKEIEECHELSYLGCTITNDGGCEREILVYSTLFREKAANTKINTTAS